MASISLTNVSLDFPLYQGSSRSLKKTLFSLAGGRSVAREGGRILVHALDNVTLHIEHGERVGLIGQNGAGKTTLLRALAGVYEPTAGVVRVEGKISALLDSGLGLNPNSTGYENIYMRGLYLGLKPEEIRALTPGIAEFTELGDFLHMPVRTYSAGMTLRLAFAVATAIKPEVLLMDEWMIAGDAKFLDKAHARIDHFVSNSEIMVLATHALHIIQEWCTQVVWMEAGRIAMIGPPEEVLPIYLAEAA